MRHTNIISSIANAFARFSNAGYELVCAFVPVEPSYESVQLSRLQLCAGYQANISLGNSRAADQGRFWNLTAKPFGDLLATGVGSITAVAMPTTSDVRDWHMSGKTRGQAKLGKS